jgi:type III secretory pathway component EscT
VVPHAGLFDVVLRQLAEHGVDPSSWVLAWARVLPATLLVPAFGMRILPVALRVLFALLLASSVAPAITPAATEDRHWVAALFHQIWLGVPVALGAAIPLWVATMTGNVADAFRGPAGPAERGAPILETGATPLGNLLGLGACAAFVRLGGPARLADALTPPAGLSPPDWLALALGLVQGIHASILLAAPLLVLSIVVEVSRGLSIGIGRGPALHEPWSAIRTVVTIIAIALVLDRLFEALVARLPLPS